ncbi:PAS domain-containing protein [Antarcticimicrobium luteum]|uniref:PAS domain-containing protein n=1 Tax=Antarcticimicrobium luteum TaxID=2547397 RepID=A0A4R5VFP6_9RHOB|nr:PAS domain-containing protein [Antarcticimicrobium luteum]TDK51385.1 PAS domain-containing protein [Antarcticimicrobium luteum]
MIDRPTDITEMTDLLSQDGRIVHACEAEETRLGLAPGGAAGQPWSLIYPVDAREQLDQVFAQTDPGPHVLTLTLRRSGGGQITTTAIVTLAADAEGTPCLRTVKWPCTGALKDLAQLAEENAVRASIQEASNDAGWCMEWKEPVDLSAPEQEIIRQVFENGPRWRFCNGAMARLYRTPEGEDFNRRPVHETFPRTRENEEFVRRLIHADFDVNGSPSRDLRYDGVFIEVENDVRGHIRGNLLYRMWGTVRDVSKYARRTAVLSDRIGMLEAVLEGLPDALLVLDRDGQVIHANLAAEELFAMPREVLMEHRLPDLIAQPLAIQELCDIAAAHVPGHPARVLPMQLRVAGKSAQAALAVRGLTLDGEDCLAASFRLRLGVAEMAGAARGAAAAQGQG